MIQGLNNPFQSQSSQLTRKSITKIGEKTETQEKLKFQFQAPPNASSKISQTLF